MNEMCNHLLAAHKRTHTDERLNECDVCHKTFKESGVLSVHMRTHTGEQPCECDVCGQSFLS